MARLGLRNKKGKSALTGFKYVLGLSMYGGGHLILSLWSGGGSPLLVESVPANDGRISTYQYQYPRD